MVADISGSEEEKAPVRRGLRGDFYERYLAYRRSAMTSIIAATAAPETLYDAIYGSLFYRYVFRIWPLTPAYARELVELNLQPR